MITYNDIYEALRKERYNEQLQILARDFIQQCGEYFKDKKDFSEKDSGLFSDIAATGKKKLENAIAMFRELLMRRRKKILNLAFVASETGISKKDFDNLLDFERELFEEIVKSLEKADKNLNESMAGDRPESKFRLVRFLEDVSEFLDLNGNSIGPFEKGEVANIEGDIVEILSKDKRVEVIDEN